MLDRTYWHVPGARSWHAYSFESRSGLVWEAMCGRRIYSGAKAELRDRLPPTAHLCGNCSRIIAARTDIELPANSSSSSQVDDVPEPVASEQDDSGVPI